MVVIRNVDYVGCEVMVMVDDQEFEETRACEGDTSTPFTPSTFTGLHLTMLSKHNMYFSDDISDFCFLIIVVLEFCLVVRLGQASRGAFAGRGRPALKQGDHIHQVFHSHYWCQPSGPL